MSIFKNKSKKKNIKDFFMNKDILITGGCGSIGSEIVKQLIKFNPKRIRVLDNNESGLFNLQQELESPLIRVLVGDIRDKERLRLAVRGSDIVFHAAALKHVPLCEYNPFEAVRTNVIGTQNLIEVAREEKVKKVIAISTDKTVNPINTMGATKLLSEKLMMTADIGENCITKFTCVRFGNVLNSVGSIIPIFRCQIKKGGPLTVTSKDMVRFFMSMPDAVKLVLKAAQLTKGRDIFILKMNKLKIIDLANVMIEKMAKKYNHNPKDMKIKIIGIRPGEKLDEELFTQEEKEHILDLNELFVLRKPKILPFSTKKIIKTKNKKISQTKNHQNIKLLNKEQISNILEEFNLI
jgi:UDP-N-acetylglucosamine 4,6-dehydratase/5-epimerase